MGSEMCIRDRGVFGGRDRVSHQVAVERAQLALRQELQAFEMRLRREGQSRIAGEVTGLAKALDDLARDALGDQGPVHPGTPASVASRLLTGAAAGGLGVRMSAAFRTRLSKYLKDRGYKGVGDYLNVAIKGPGPSK